MGVHGLWKLIESSGKPIPLETLENKVLAVDVSIWLHQAIKGFQDHKGAPVPNAHLLGIYHRVCKLLYFKIKPIFVFDGGVPALKRQTIAKRNQYKSKNASEADRLQKQLLSTLLKHTAISKVLSEKTKASLPVIKKSSGKYDNLYAPPTEEFESVLSSSDDDLDESSETTTTDSSPTKQWDLHTIDTTSHYFKSLPLEVKHDILTDLKETRKQNSWGKLHQLPKQSDDFSSYQMKRLLKRKEVQSALDEVSKEMGGMSLSLAELESLLKDQGIKTTNDSNIGKRIASDDKTRYLYIKDIQEEIKKAEKGDAKTKDMPAIVEEEAEDEELKKAIQLSLEEIPSTSKIDHPKIHKKSKADIEEEEELNLAIQLSLEGDQSIQNKKAKSTFLENFNDEDFESDSDDDFVPTPKSKKVFHKKMSSAQNYMMEYSGLTPAEIDRILMTNKKVPSKPTFKNIKLNEMNSNSIKSLQNEKRILAVSETVVDIPETKVEESKQTIKHVDDFKEKSIKTHKEVVEKPDTIHEVEIMSDSGDSNDEQQTIEIGDNKEKSIESRKESIEKSGDIKDEVEVMSDSGDSDDGILRRPIEIVIDPNKIKQDGLDDLFDDIFEKEADDQIGNSITTSNKVKLHEVNVPDLSSKNVEDDHVKDVSIDTSRSESDSYTQEIVDKSEETLDKDDSNTIKMHDVIEEPKDENISTIITDLKTDANKVITTDEEYIQNPSKDDLKISELTVEEMQQLKDTYQREKIDLLKEKSNKERLANNITDQMYQEAQELLELFGVPYVVAPMEAEAQCAFLDEIELTDGTITDDSDIWLFGGKTVYKNFFNQSKYVMEFKSESIEHHFKLSRLQMILLAFLVGSDYTTGIQGVGPVTALEILASFPPAEQHEFTLSHHQVLSGLKEFKSWYLKGKTGGPGRSVLKNKLKNISFADHFPNPQVVEAYLDPKIETSRDPFSWSKPDIIGLTIFAQQKFGWTIKKTEEILNPIIKRLEENHSQKSIKDYFKTKFKVDSLNIEGKVSKRVKSAIDRFGKTQDELIAEEMVQLEKEKRKATGKQSSSKNSKSKSNKHTKKSSKNKEDAKETDIDPVNNQSKDEEANQDTVKEKEINNSHTKRTIKKRKEPNEASHSSEQLNNKKEKLSKETVQNKEGKGKSVPRRKRDKRECDLENSEVEPKTKNKVANKKSQPEGNSRSLDQLEAIKDYENLAVELKNRRKRKNELMKIKIDNPVQKKSKIVPEPVSSVEHIPQELTEDEDIKILKATTSNSARIVNEINRDVSKMLEEKPKSRKAVVPTKSLHTKDVIHQRLRDKSTSLRNKIKAIEVYRKSKLGPGYVPKRKKTVLIPKEDAELSEESD
ncbi:DNA excision repair protein ERCC-5 isoform X1 [Diabrotica virgifera virgifera]|uniref:DNA repair protein complementing XP-G cells homolog n=1 Tax=Diabrotica virgifera virgifera TaxID=50390 RepID=A0ABM5IBS2_DIAVI|nr:DNA excision repair protein ERCC-5 isoform X1 [Diabrotica virgifera virgifera]